MNWHKLSLKIIGIIFVMSMVSTVQADELVDGVIAVVGGEIILQSDVKAAQIYHKDKFGSKESKTFNEILEDLIQERLLQQEMVRLKIEATPDEVNETLRGVLMQNKMTIGQLKSELKTKGVSFAVYKEDLANRIRMMKFMRQFVYSTVEVSDADIEAYQRRYPQKSTQQSAEEIRESIMEVKAREAYRAYVNGVRERTYVEIKKLS